LSQFRQHSHVVPEPILPEPILPELIRQELIRQELIRQELIHPELIRPELIRQELIHPELIRQERQLRPMWDPQENHPMCLIFIQASKATRPIAISSTATGRPGSSNGYRGSMSGGKNKKSTTGGKFTLYMQTRFV
jgi:hypothetical protein